MSEITSQVQPTPSGPSNEVTAQAPPNARPSEHPDYPPSSFTLPKQRGLPSLARRRAGRSAVARHSDSEFDRRPLRRSGVGYPPCNASVLRHVHGADGCGCSLQHLVAVLQPPPLVGPPARLPELRRHRYPAPYFLYHSTINIFGLIILILPTVMTAWVGWLLIASFLSWPIRRAGLLVVLVLAWGSFALLRFDGVTGSMKMTLSLRWSQTAEERFLAEHASRKKSAEVLALVGEKAPDLNPGDWPAFRGEARWSSSGRPPRYGLDEASAEGIVAAPSRTGLGFVRRYWRPPLHARAARRQGNCCLLQRQDGRRSLGARRRRPLYRSGGWPWPPRDAHLPRRQNLRLWSYRKAQLSRRGNGQGDMAARCHRRLGRQGATVGLRVVAADRARCGVGLRRRPQWEKRRGLRYRVG